MEAQVFTVTRTGLYVLKLSDPRKVPKIGTLMQANDVRLKIVDVIGPIEEPFVVVKPISNERELKGSLKLLPVKRGRKAKSRRRR